MMNNVERKRSLEQLSRIADEKEVIKFIYHPDGFIRLTAVKRLQGRSSEVLISHAACLLNDNFSFVAEAAAELLASIGTKQSLEILACHLNESQQERLPHIANAISKFGMAGLNELTLSLKSPNPNVRYYACRGIGSVGDPETLFLLEPIAASDHEATSFGGLVSTAAKKAIKTLKRIHESG